MSANSTIEWTDATWNPVRGCVKISPGCKHCYAATFAERFRGVLGHPYEQGFDLRLVPGKLTEPLTWPAQRTVFVNSMSDLFQLEISNTYIKRVVDVMAMANWHTFQVLTKRHDRMSELLKGKLSYASSLKHIWWGVSVEDKRFGLPRIDVLRQTPAALRFLSIEPLLEDLGEINLSGIDWVIVGGESGRGARSMKVEWVDSIKEQCQAAKVPFFFKQWGGVQKSKAGRQLHGLEYNQMPERIINAIPHKNDRMHLAEIVRSWENDFAEEGSYAVAT